MKFTRPEIEAMARASNLTLVWLDTHDGEMPFVRGELFSPFANKAQNHDLMVDAEIDVKYKPESDMVLTSCWLNSTSGYGVQGLTLDSCTDKSAAYRIAICNAAVAKGMAMKEEE